jgi:uncharacterized protein (TIGR01244 family)
MIPLDDKMLVAGQIAPGDLAALAALGVTMVINNRPDGEEIGQPEGGAIAEAAKAAGLDYRFIPVAGGFSEAQVLEMAGALDAAQDKVLAFCRSGTRSCFLWALARSRLGDSADALIGKAEKAGFDLRPIAPYLGSV